MANELNIKSQTTLRELEDTISNLNIPIVMFKLLLEAVKNNDFSELPSNIAKLRYMTSEEKVKEQIDNIIYQPVYNNKDYNAWILLITKIYAIIDSLIEARMNITDMYKQDLDIVEDSLDSYGFDIHKIFDENSKRELAANIYYFLRRKGTPNLIGEFLTRIGYTDYAINEYYLTRDKNLEWKFVPETIVMSDGAKEHKDDYVFSNIDFNGIDDSLWYLNDPDKLNDIYFKNTRMLPSTWKANYKVESVKTHKEILQPYVNLIADHEWVHDARMSICGNKLMLINRIDYFTYHNGTLEEFPDTCKVLDGFGNILYEYSEGVLDESLGDQGYANIRIYCHIINLETNQIEQEYVLADEAWYVYYRDMKYAEWAEIYPLWQPNTEYKKGDIVKLHDTSFVECQRDHVSSGYYDNVQDGIRTWYRIYPEKCSYWSAKGYLSSDWDEWDEANWYTGCFDDEDNNIIYLFCDYAPEFLKINTKTNDVECINLNEYEHLFGDNTLSVTTSIHKIVGKYKNYFIIASVDNSYEFFNINTKKWFSLTLDFIDNTNSTIYLETVYWYRFSDGLLKNNKLYIKFEDVNTDDNTYYGIKQIDINNIESVITNFQELETDNERTVFISEYFNSLPTYIIDDFYDVLEYTCFHVGRDNNIYVSGEVKPEIYEDKFEDYYLNSDYQLRVYDQNMNLLNILATGSPCYIIGMDMNNNLHTTEVENWASKIVWNENSSDYYFYMYNYIKFKPILDLKIKIINTINTMLQTVKNYNINYIEKSYYRFIRNHTYSTYLPPGSRAIMCSSEINLFVVQGTRHSGLYKDHELHNIFEYDIINNCWNNISKDFIPYNVIYNEYYDNQYSVYINNDIYFLNRDGYIIKFNKFDGYTRIPKGFYKTYNESKNKFQYSTMHYYNGKLYIFGDNINNNSELWEYNISSDIWTQKTSCPSGKQSHSSAIIKNKLYIIHNPDVWEYDILTDTWTQKADFIGPTINRMSATTYQRKIYYYQYGILYEYNQLNNVWSVINDSSGVMPTASNSDDREACLVSANDALYLYYTYATYNSEENKLYKYDFSTNAWEEKSLQLCSSLPGKNIDFTTTVTSIREVRGEEVIVPYPVESIDTVCISYTVTITNNDSTHTTKVCIEIGDTFPIAWAMLADGVYVDNYGVPWHTIDLGPNESKEVTLLVGGPCYDDPRCYFPHGINPTIAIASDFSEVTLHFTYVVEYNAETVPDDYTLALYGPDGPLRASDFGAV